MGSILLKNGTVLDYGSKTNEKLDIKIEDGKITKIEKDINETADKVLDCSGLYIMPGLIDMHCHLREPGFEYKETIELLKRYAYNKGNIEVAMIEDSTYKRIMDMDIAEQIKMSAIEYKIVKQALNLSSCDAKMVFDQFFVQGKTKWTIMNEFAMSARTFERRKNELIYATQKEYANVKKSNI